MPYDQDLQSIQEARRLVEKAAEAQKILEHFSQEQVDAVVAACAEAARQNAEPLARLAVEETTYGVVADKVVKNLFSARDVYNAIKNMKTVGILREDKDAGVVEIAVPAGVVAAIIPTTNPTSTAIFKALISLKARNAIVMSPHPSAVRCIRETVRVMYEAALKAGAPEGSIGCLSAPSNEATEELMRHRSTAIILATGGTGLVRAAYSSGKPALGVGPGNVPSYIHRSANIRKAVADVLTGKCFDNGTLCSSEQHMVVDAEIAAQVKTETERRGGFFLSKEQAAAVARVLILPNFRVNSKMVGQSADKIAKAAGFDVPKGTRALVAPLEGIGKEYPLSAEKLSPVLSFYVVKDSNEGREICNRFLRFGGMGHTMSIHASDENVIREFALSLPAFRMVVNSPASHGSVGYTTGLFPSMSLGCGTPGGNITSDNISPMNLLNIKRLAYERSPVNRADGTAEPARGSSETSPVHRSSPMPPTAPPASAPTAPSAVQSKADDRADIARIVQRFMGATNYPPGPSKEAAPEPGPASKATGNTAPRPVDFVSEEDVRIALKKGEKIYIGPRTIVTPSARDLGGPSEVFVLVG
ncbi:MAG TPA: aldehyde dehydrogenase family protein [Terriglobia bacterium]|nr:aldehyde dehydrogenase family protein [Terriglobia bacterium]